ncbi:MAG: glycine oxidase ThiO [Myxococcota bacterium]
MAPRRFDLIIVGGGVIGVSIAERLSQEGLKVALLEGEALAAGASGAAAGMLAPLGEAHTGGPLLDLGLQSLALFEGLCARLKDEAGIDPEFERSGLLEVAFDPEEAARLEAKRTQAESSAGAWPFDPELERVDPADLRRAEPALSGDALAGLFSPHEAHLRPPLLVRALAQSARDRGVTFLTGVRAERLLCAGSRISGVETSAGRFEAEQVVVAAGAWSPSLLAASGLARPQAEMLPVRPIRGQILQLDAPLPGTRAICWAPGIYTVPKRDGSWVVGATEESVGFDRRVTAEGVATLLERARRLFPELRDASFTRAWAGLRPVSADGLPWVGPWAEVDGLWVAAGHGRNGVLLSAVTSQILGEAILGKSKIEATHPLCPSPDRLS